MLRLACVGIIKNENNEVLITKRGVQPFQYQYVMPGGKLEPGESVYSCVKREVLEEVGIKVISAELYDIYEVFLPYTQYLILYFICSVSNVATVIDNCEVLETVWINRENFKDYDITEGTEYILSKIFQLKDYENKIGIKDFR
jgi:8-oxo-dGTP diphosphatase